MQDPGGRLFTIRLKFPPFISAFRLMHCLEFWWVKSGHEAFWTPVLAVTVQLPQPLGDRKIEPHRRPVSPSNALWNRSAGCNGMCQIRWCPALLVAEGTRTESEGTALTKMHKREFSDNSSQRVIELRSNANKCDWIITKGRYDQEGFAKTLSKQEFFCLFFP